MDNAAVVVPLVSMLVDWKTQFPGSGGCGVCHSGEGLRLQEFEVQTGLRKTWLCPPNPQRRGACSDVAE